MTEKITFEENEPVDYIKEQLSMGSLLARSLLETIDLSDGDVIVYLPQGTTRNQRIGFEYGGIVTTGSSREQTTQFVIDYLTLTNQAYVVYEDVSIVLENLTHSPYLTPLHKAGHQYFTYGKQLYYFLSSIDKEQQKIDRILRLLLSYPGIGVLTSLPNTSNKIQNQMELLPVTFEEIIRNTEHILVEAYDGEAYLIWSRHIEAKK